MDQKRSPRQVPPTAGKLARLLVAGVRAAGQDLPITTHIHCAFSGGLDSTVLAHLLIHYGRRVGGVSLVRLLHINHGWRGKHSDADEQFARACAKAWGVPIDVVTAKPGEARGQAGRSDEEVARAFRKKAYQAQVKKWGGVVFTAHHQDDVAETLLWRWLSGGNRKGDAGILPVSGVELRPFLAVKKALLKTYAHEAGLSWREDSSNQDTRFLRAKMRAHLVPALQEIFPRWVENVTQSVHQDESATTEAAASLSFLGQRLQPEHYVALRQLESQKGRKKGGGEAQVQLPGGWRATYEFKQSRWIFEKVTQSPRHSEN